MKNMDKCRMVKCNGDTAAFAWITTLGVKHPVKVCHDCAMDMMACGCRVKWFAAEGGAV
jgi:hypothetical protein